MVAAELLSLQAGAIVSLPLGAYLHDLAPTVPGGHRFGLFLSKPLPNWLTDELVQNVGLVVASVAPSLYQKLECSPR